MGLKTHTGQANPNINIKAQANTLSAKPLSPFKSRGTVKQSQTKPIPQTQTEPLPKSQTVGLSKPKQSQTKEPQPLSPSREPTLSPSRRQFIEQYGAYALVTPVALYAMMSPNRAMAQAGSAVVAVVVARPTVLKGGERIENFDINTKTDGEVTSDDDLKLREGEKYIAPDGVIYTCGDINVCYITPTAGGGGVASRRSTFDITYPVAADTTDDAADPVDDPVVDDRPRIIGRGGKIDLFDINHNGGGLARIIQNGELIIRQGEKYIASDGTAYTCVASTCYIKPLPSGGGILTNFSIFTIAYPT